MAASRSRQEKRRGTSRRSGTLIDRRTQTVSTREPVAHSQRRRSSVPWRLFSAAIVLCLSIVLAIFFTADAFYVRSVAVGGLSYLTKEEIFTFADIATWHIFWVDPEAVRENLLESPSIADAQVWLSWPPDMVQIVVEEREPIFIWEESERARWVDLNGRLMTQRENRADLMRVFVDIPMEDAPDRLSEDVVYGVLQLQEALPETTFLRYDAMKGLGYKNENGWDIWFGTGVGMAERVAIYRSIADNLAARGIQPYEINVMNPDSPYYTVMWGR